MFDLKNQDNSSTKNNNIPFFLLFKLKLLFLVSKCEYHNKSRHIFEMSFVDIEASIAIEADEEFVQIIRITRWIENEAKVRFQVSDTLPKVSLNYVSNIIRNIERTTQVAHGQPEADEPRFSYKTKAWCQIWDSEFWITIFLDWKLDLNIKLHLNDV